MVGLLMKSICAWSIKEKFWFGWVGLIFFAGGSIMFLIKAINPNFRWVNDTDIHSKKFSDKTRADFKKLYNDNGIFAYSDNGFTIKTEKGDKTIEWTQVNKLTGYKRDYFTTDCICLVVEYDDNQNFEITEEHSGWFRFLEHLKQAFPSIDKSWEIEISTPAFATNLTVLYDRANENVTSK